VNAHTMKTAALDLPFAPTAVRAGVVGPNAVLQLTTPLRQAVGEAGLHDIFNRAGVVHWLRQPPLAMVSEERARRLFEAVLEELGPKRGAEVLFDAGAGTARYVMANRIPRPVCALLRVLPAALAGPLLLRAIERHAWTFAGSGDCRTDNRQGFTIIIRNNPLATPNCPWHQGVLQTLFQSLVSPRCELDYARCGGRTCSCCRFQITLR